MNEQKNKKYLITISVTYFVIFLIMPAFILGSGLFVKDIGWFYEYLVKIYTFTSVFFLIAVMSVLGFTKKRLFALLSLIIVSYVISAIFLYIRVGMLFANSNIFSF